MCRGAHNRLCADFDNAGDGLRHLHGFDGRVERVEAGGLPLFEVHRSPALGDFEAVVVQRRAPDVEARARREQVDAVDGVAGEAGAGAVEGEGEVFTDDLDLVGVLG